jgi:hypothetical protein
MIRSLCVLALVLLAGCDSQQVVVLSGRPAHGCAAHAHVVASELKWAVRGDDYQAFQKVNASGLDYDDAKKFVHVLPAVRVLVDVSLLRDSRYDWLKSISPPVSGDAPDPEPMF